MIESVCYMDQRSAEARVPGSADAIISITNTTTPAALRPGWAQVLRTCFPDAGCSRELLDFVGGYENYLNLGYFNHRHAQEIRDFVAHLSAAPENYRLHIHCYAGKSRSAAVARYVAKREGLPFDFDYTGYNTTVLAMLEDPYCFAPPGYQDGLGTGGWGGFVKSVRHALGRFSLAGKT